MYDDKSDVRFKKFKMVDQRLRKMLLKVNQGLVNAIRDGKM